jgi:dTDP-4-dehydrorhamnose reductase
MSILVGSTGFLGGYLLRGYEFSQAVHRSNIYKIKSADTDLLVCAGLPAEKWKANADPESDWKNTTELAQVLSTVRSEQVILISTIDVYQPAVHVTEKNFPNLSGIGAYGRNRAWFEVFFKSHFENLLIVRLPGLIAPDLKKNFVFDLMNNKSDQLKKINRNSKFQFFNTEEIWNVIKICFDKNISLLNITSEPILAQEIADLFNVKLDITSPEVAYDVRSIHDREFNGDNGYLYTKEKILRDIHNLTLKN